jgi:DnaJ-class molecular chaperone
MRDPYTVLGVPRTASEAEIKKAFRKLAKEHHPDRSSGNPRSKDIFAEANNAYEIVGDAEKRAQFDRGEIGPDGKPKFQGFDGFAQGGRRGGFEHAMGGGPFAGRGGFNPSDIFGDFFNQGAGRAARGEPPKGQDMEAVLNVTLGEIAEGATKRLRLPSGREVDVTVPRVVTDGKVIRLRGLGHPSPFGGETGDVLLTLKIAADPRFTVEGRDLRTRLVIPLRDAVLGGPVRVPTLKGEVEMTLPPMTSSGKSFRLRGKGLPGESGQPDGDLFATLDIALPEQDAELTALMQRRRD